MRRDSVIPYTRRKKILEFMQSKEMVYLEEIQKQVNVSFATIRRDLKSLSEEGYIEQLSGGAARIIANVAEKSLSEKINLNKEEKEAIGKYASNLVESGDFIYIGPGTTENHMIKYLQGKSVTLVTNGAFHIQELIKYDINAILLGGDILTNIGVLVGPVTLNQISTMNFDKCFIGASGITFDRGVSTSDIDVAEINKIAIKNSKKVYFVGDSTKIGKNSRYTFAQLEEHNKLITTRNIEKKYQDDKRLIFVD